MVDPTPELMMEILRKIQADVSGMKSDIRRMDANITGLRQQFHTREGFDLRQEEAIAALQVEVERIKTRLELSDAP